MIYVYCSLGPLLELDRRTYQHRYIVFFLFFRFGYEMLLLIEIFCWMGLDLIRFCFGFFGFSIKKKKILNFKYDLGF